MSDLDLKIDWSVYTKEEKVEPKTLEECLKEAGGFPFTAKAIVDGNTATSWPTGIVMSFGERYKNSEGFIPVGRPNNPNRPLKKGGISTVLSTFPRWQLLGAL